MCSGIGNFQRAESAAMEKTNKRQLLAPMDKKPAERRRYVDIQDPIGLEKTLELVALPGPQNAHSGFGVCIK